MGDIRSFEASLDAFVKEDIPQTYATTARLLTAHIISALIKRSPVGNPELWESKPHAGYVGGRFRSGWVAQAVTKSNYFPAADAGNYSVPDADAVAQKAASALTPYGSIWISNNVPYGPRLEDGWSTQAPAGMVALTLAELKG